MQQLNVLWPDALVRTVKMPVKETMEWLQDSGEDIMASPLTLDNHSCSMHGDFVDEFQDNTKPAFLDMNIQE